MDFTTGHCPLGHVATLAANWASQAQWPVWTSTRARARKNPTPARATTARPGSSGHAEGSARRGLPLVTLKRRRLPLMVAGAKLYGNGGRWRGTAPKSVTLSTF